jgi:hypothetical protein
MNWKNMLKTCVKTELKSGKRRKTKAKIPIIPTPSKNLITERIESGAIAYKTREPSRGGKGIILKRKKLIFTSTKRAIIESSSDEKLFMPTLKISPAMTANIKFVSGPAMPTIAAPKAPHFRLYGSNGTGFAAPKGGSPRKSRTKGKRMVVNRSICARGLSVSLPSLEAVSSPSQWLVKACIASCKVIDIRMDTKTTEILRRLTCIYKQYSK